MTRWMMVVSMVVACSNSRPDVSEQMQANAVAPTCSFPGPGTPTGYGTTGCRIQPGGAKCHPMPIPKCPNGCASTLGTGFTTYSTGYPSVGKINPTCDVPVGTAACDAMFAGSGKCVDRLGGPGDDTEFVVPPGWEIMAYKQACETKANSSSWGNYSLEELLPKFPNCTFNKEHCVLDCTCNECTAPTAVSYNIDVDITSYWLAGGGTYENCFGVLLNLPEQPFEGALTLTRLDPGSGITDDPFTDQTAGLGPQAYADCPSEWTRVPGTDVAHFSVSYDDATYQVVDPETEESVAGFHTFQISATCSGQNCDLTPYPAEFDLFTGYPGVSLTIGEDLPLCPDYCTPVEGGE